MLVFCWYIIYRTWSHLLFLLASEAAAAACAAAKCCFANAETPATVGTAEGTAAAGPCEARRSILHRNTLEQIVRENKANQTSTLFKDFWASCSVTGLLYMQMPPEHIHVSYFKWGDNIGCALDQRHTFTIRVPSMTATQSRPSRLQIHNL